MIDLRLYVALLTLLNVFPNLGVLAQDHNPDMILLHTGFGHYMLEDPEGRKLGFDEDYRRHSEIPNAQSYTEGGSDDPDVPGDIRIMEIMRVVPGTYDVTLFGIEPTIAELVFGYADEAGNQAQATLYAALSYNEMASYRIRYTPNAEKVITIEKIVTPTSVQQELGAMQELGWFEDAALFDELDRHLQQAQDRLAQGDSAGAREAVAAFRAQLNEAGDAIGENGYEILSADAESLQAQLPETEDPVPPSPEPPPVNGKADVRPTLECVIDNRDGTLTAYFGYENHHGEPVTIPHGPKNKITPAIYEQLQPEAFFMPGVVPGRPGRTAAYPEHAFSITFDEDRRVRWKLGRGQVTASSGTERCPE